MPNLKPILAAAADPQPDPFALLASLPVAVLAVGHDRVIRFVNLAAQQLLDASESALLGQELTGLVPGDSPLFALIDQAIQQDRSVADYGMLLESPRIGRRTVSVTVAPLVDPPDIAVVSLFEESVARRIDTQLNRRHAARSMTAMAAMLAHEIKNPLSGIRGAAQLLEQTVGDEDRALTRLICEETDRIVRLVDRMDAFSDPSPLNRDPVNIHEVLERARQVAQTGFGRHVRFIERYDPSLPPVSGQFDQLVQVFLNLIKNAVEAVAEDGEIVLTTAYQRGVAIAVQGTSQRLNLPLMVAIQDNGPGIPDDLKDHLFDPFVTTKAEGSGLGLALVAKIIGDHGGLIGFESEPRRTVFKISLPIHAGAVSTGNGEDNGSEA
ncbi:MAG: PAS domain-containing protein [Inquilinus limosus]|uniref:histidine kinase n=1 Tax=Inquilinus limosus TaxID=171674 RepID=A0A952KL17_9PROT|nr:PAS domain-containing protein [Inquilinus limosus]